MCVDGFATFKNASDCFGGTTGRRTSVRSEKESRRLAFEGKKWKWRGRCQRQNGGKIVKSQKTLKIREDERFVAYLSAALNRGRAPAKLVRRIDGPALVALRSYFVPLILRISELENEAVRCHKKMASIHAIVENDSSIVDE
jgi:hypothetical protein